MVLGWQYSKIPFWMFSSENVDKAAVSSNGLVKISHRYLQQERDTAPIKQENCDALKAKRVRWEELFDQEPQIV